MRDCERLRTASIAGVFLFSLTFGCSSQGAPNPVPDCLTIQVKRVNTANPKPNEPEQFLVNIGFHGSQHVLREYAIGCSGGNYTYLECDLDWRTRSTTSGHSDLSFVEASGRMMAFQCDSRDGGLIECVVRAMDVREKIVRWQVGARMFVREGEITSITEK